LSSSSKSKDNDSGKRAIDRAAEMIVGGVAGRQRYKDGAAIRGVIIVSSV
jgi:hypothetical protein